MPVIFISYRRSDSQDVTGRIYDRLVAKFAQKQVFKDVDSIPLGVSFPTHIKQMLSKANIALVIIGPTWLTATDERGKRRLDDPSDFVRMEIEAALRAKIPVIPVLVSNACIPSTVDLPTTIQPLAARNGIKVRPDPDFNNDMVRLLSGIERLERLLKIQTEKENTLGKDAASVGENPGAAAEPLETSALEKDSPISQYKSGGQSQDPSATYRERLNKFVISLMMVGVILTIWTYMSWGLVASLGVFFLAFVVLVFVANFLDGAFGEKPDQKP